MKHICSFLFCFHISLIIFAQQVAIGDWDMHLNYTHINTLTHNDTKIYVGTQSALFSYNLSTGDMVAFSKLDGLSSLNISALAYSNEDDMLIIGYNDGQIDIMKNEEIISIPYIKMANILGSKTINHIFIDNELSYISCPFGLVVLNTDKNEIKETYYFSQGSVQLEVLTTYVFNDEVNTPSDEFLANKIFVGTNKGLFYADKNDNLLDHANWSNNCYFSEKLGGLAGIGPNGHLREISHLIGFDKDKLGGKSLIVGASDENFGGSGSASGSIFKLVGDTYSNPSSLIMFETPGDLFRGQLKDVRYNHELQKVVLLLNRDGSDKFAIWDAEWTNNTQDPLFNNFSTYSSNLSVSSVLIANNYNNSKNIFFGDQKRGLIIAEFEDELGILDLVAPNGPAGVNVGAITSNGTAVGLTHGGRTTAWNNTYNKQEISFFNNGLWSQSNTLIEGDLYDAVSISAGPTSNTHFFVGTWNSGVLEFIDNTFVNHYTEDGTSLETIPGTDWIRIGGVDLDDDNTVWMTNSSTEKPLVKYSGGVWEAFSVSTGGTMSGKILCTRNNQQWIQLRNNGLLVTKEVSIVGQGGQTYNDIEYRSINENSGLASNTVNCFVEDNEGSVWVGTNLGLSVCYFTSGVFNNSDYSAESILVETQDGYVEKLFNNTEILDICVDGGNRKWVGTKSNGVFLISDDGTETIQHFTKENSPLLDNSVYQICVLGGSGEVFFVTGSGVCSYRSNATESNPIFNDVLVFPNPVRKNYQGEIAVSGLSDNTNVKITDISGNLIFETNSIGGTITWNGRKFNGERVSTGVYLFMCTNADFTESIVKKVLIYN